MDLWFSRLWKLFCPHLIKKADSPTAFLINKLHLTGGLCFQPTEHKTPAKGGEADFVLCISDAWCSNTVKVDRKCFPNAELDSVMMLTNLIITISVLLLRLPQTSPIKKKKMHFRIISIMYTCTCTWIINLQPCVVQGQINHLDTFENHYHQLSFEICFLLVLSTCHCLAKGFQYSCFSEIPF